MPPMNRTLARTCATAAPIAAIAMAATLVDLDAARLQPQIQVLRSEQAPANAIWLDSLDLTRMVQRRGTPRAGAYGGPPAAGVRPRP